MHATRSGINLDAFPNDVALIFGFARTEG